MKPPETPEDEKLRLAKLRSLCILDTAQESRFDRLTRMAQRIFKVPIVIISLVDEDRQWFKSCVGLNVLETPRSISFCGHAILDSDVFIVEDTLEDDRFCDNPLVIGEPHIRFYAGCPLILEHHKLGTLCIADHVPRSLDQEQLDNLKDLASIVVQELGAILLATKDELTNLENRRGFLALAQQSLQLCTRQGISVSLLSLDLEHFKTINDLHGRQEGDQALITFADLIKNVCRDSDVVARLGGDKFVVLLINSTREQSETVIDRIREALENQNRFSGNDYAIDFCYGITSYQPERHETIAELLADSNALMHEIRQLRTLATIGNGTPERE
ncbi:sensor domain-containing diguanylate cyclase [Synechococcus sp. CS-1332]|uniref:sensor domain-containing diguanylate cyclase n=1 Tax=Synechococcus sp. CS-1332 TaxID=2847972 RepID=UPI00223B0FC3|nr:sensor domain-containing diguanylate cyclase [Synechococcus sp. CS-1332]MCT0206894.1 sensor domain-containing diguanylate cyclase [Synechococcus sp. CS-1332]